MVSLIEVLALRSVGAIEEVRPDYLVALLDVDAPQVIALNTGSPQGFPRLNGYVLIPNQVGATVGMISTIRIERLPYPKRKGMQDFGLIDLPFPSRLVHVTPIGTLTTRETPAGPITELSRGVDVSPSVGDVVILPTESQLRAIVEGEGSASSGRIFIGRSPTANQAPIHADPDRLFGRHLAVLGNTGAGKSCSVAGLIRWSIDGAAAAIGEAEQTGSPNARFLVLDPNGEYARAFEDMDVRLFQVDPATGAQPLKVPAWLWNGDEWAAFSEASPGVQRPLLFEAIRRLRSGVDAPDAFEAKVAKRVRRYQTHFRLGLASGAHQTAGKREGIARHLTNLVEDLMGLGEAAETDDDSLVDLLEETAGKALEVERAAHSNKDASGKQWHDSFSDESIEGILAELEQIGRAVGIEDEAELVGEDTPKYFNVDELPEFVEALAADASGRDLAQFVDSLNLRIRGLLSRGRLAAVARPDDSQDISLAQWLEDYIGGEGAANGSIAIIDLSLVPSEVVHVIVAVLSRMTFEAVQRYRRERGNELPTVFVLEEAHSFIHRDMASESAAPSGRACYRVFEKIAREGRKFGLGLVLASQRPSEMSPTVLSQCNTFLLHRIVNDRDQDLVRRLVPDALGVFLRELPSLPTRRAVLLGWAAPAPVLVEMRELPIRQRPHSPDPAFWDVWTLAKERPIDWEAIVDSWVPSGSSGAKSQDVSENSGGSEA